MEWSANLVKWHHTRQRGLAQFVLVYGVLTVGLGMAVFFAITFPLTMTMLGRGNLDLDVLTAGFGFVLLPFGGGYWAVKLWEFTGRAYARAIREDRCLRCSHQLQGSRASGRDRRPECAEPRVEREVVAS